MKTLICTLLRVSLEEKQMFRYGELIEVPDPIILFLMVAGNTAKFIIDFVEEF